MEEERKTGPVYEQPFEVCFRDGGPDGRMKLSALNALLSDYAGLHYARKGMDHAWLWEHGFVFLLSKVSLSIRRMPAPDETIFVKTWEREVKGAAFYRSFSIRTPEDECLVTADTAWMLVNPETRKVLRPSAFENADPTGIPVECPPCEKLKLDGGEAAGTRLIRWSDLDGNGHVYNAVYSDIAVDCLPPSLRERRLTAYQINFAHEAVLGDTIALFIGEAGPDTVLVKGTVEGRDCFVASFTFATA